MNEFWHATHIGAEEGNAKSETLEHAVRGVLEQRGQHSHAARQILQITVRRKGRRRREGRTSTSQKSSEKKESVKRKTSER